MSSYQTHTTAKLLLKRHDFDFWHTDKTSLINNLFWFFRVFGMNRCISTVKDLSSKILLQFALIYSWPWLILLFASWFWQNYIYILIYGSKCKLNCVFKGLILVVWWNKYVSEIIHADLHTIDDVCRYSCPLMQRWS